MRREGVRKSKYEMREKNKGELKRRKNRITRSILKMYELIEKYEQIRI